jgi:hypothetical protein
MNNTLFGSLHLRPFATWLLRGLRAANATGIVAVERKGARLVDALVQWGADVGMSWPCEVRYRRALDYRGAFEAGEGLALAVVDDATFTNHTLVTCHDQVLTAEHRVAGLFTCLRKEERQVRGEAEGRGLEIQAWQTCEEPEYTRWVWDITDFATSDGLPAEVDHRQFILKLDASVEAWFGRLVRALRMWGPVSLYAPTDSCRWTATVHWPDFFRTPGGATSALQADGVCKIRLFADLQRDQLVCIPMFFPQLRVPLRPERTEEDTVLDLLPQGVPAARSVAAELMSHARTASPRVMYDAVVTACDVLMVRGLLGALHDVHIDCEAEPVEEHLTRLYGATAGAAVSGKIRDALVPEVVRPPSETRTLVPHVERSLYYSVLASLKSAWLRHNEGIPREKWETVTSSFAEILRDVPEVNAAGPIALSAVMDVACPAGSLAAETVVVADQGRGQALVQRGYRTVESVWLTTWAGLGLCDVLRKAGHEAQARLFEGFDFSHGAFDGQLNDLEMSTEVIALVAHVASKVNQGWREGLGVTAANKVVDIAIKARPWLMPQGLRAISGTYGKRVVYQPGNVEPIRLDEEEQKNYRFKSVSTEHGEEKLVQPTQIFLAAYPDRLCLGESRVGPLEDLFAEILRESQPSVHVKRPVADALLGWSLCAVQEGVVPTLGLGDYSYDLEQVLRLVGKALAGPLGGGPLDSGRVRAAAEALGGRHVAEGSDWWRAAADKVALLSTGEPAQMKARLQSKWHTRGSGTTRNLLQTLQPPDSSAAAPVYRLGRALCLSVRGLVEALPCLAEWSSLPTYRGTGLEDATRQCMSAWAVLNDCWVRLTCRRPYLETVTPVPGSAREPAQQLELAAQRAQLLVRAMGCVTGGEPPSWEPAGPVGVLACDLDKSRIGAWTKANGQRFEGWLKRWQALCRRWVWAIGGADVGEPGNGVIALFPSLEGAALCASLIDAHLAAICSTGDPQCQYVPQFGLAFGQVADPKASEVVFQAVSVAKVPRAIVLAPKAVENAQEPLCRAWHEYTGPELAEVSPAALRELTPSVIVEGFLGHLEQHLGHL